MEQSNDAIYLLDPTSLVFLDANPAYCHLVGYDLDALRAMTLFDIALDETGTLEEAAASARQDGGYINGARRHRCQDGRVVDLYISASRIQYDKREALCIVARDMSEQRRYQDELLRAKEHAEAMLRLKSTFLSNMSHELRTPLTAILGFSELLAEEVSEESKQYVEVIRSGADRLYQTLNAVLDLAQLEGDRVEMKPVSFDLKTELSNALLPVRAQASAKGLRIRTSLPDGPLRVYADRMSTRRILGHVLSNAIKFTKVGSITITAGIEGMDTATVRVRDTGIGIEPTFLPQLFDEFKQASWGYHRSHEGAGLGLSIAKRLTTLMDGTLTVSSEMGSGSEFTLRLPGASAPDGLGGDSIGGDSMGVRVASGDSLSALPTVSVTLAPMRARPTENT